MMPLGTGAVCLALAGCVSIGHVDLADDQIMAQIKVGESTMQQVAGLLGEPDSRHVMELGGAKREWWSYSYASAIINPLDYLLIYGLFFNGIGLYDTRYDLGLFFDHRDVVSSLSRTKTDYDLGRPFAAGLITNFSDKTLGAPEPAKAPMRFDDRFQFPH